MFDIITDAEKGISALIDTENGRALGPVIQTAEHDGEELLRLFVGGINKDPASLHPTDLETLFKGFVAALADDVDPTLAAPPSETAAAPSQPGSGLPPEQAAPAGQPSVEPAGPGVTGGLAGSLGGGETAAAGDGQATPSDVDGPVADGGLPTGIEQAAPGRDVAASASLPTPDQPGQPATGAPWEGGGIPKA